ncbi:hypothetical protein [Chlamydiifrater volucris]|uniref:hypothetical protein n=1 Tax=Chlamydiifrater volucris TaxID=2681470 RepID=UPI001BD158F0|nr:hypothetical protein [Chlamydiifrater volucris]
MSSWLSQSCDIILSQKNYPSACETNLEAEPTRHSFSLKPKESQNISHTFSKVFEKNVPKQTSGKPLELMKDLIIKVCSKKEAILHFGFSEKSLSLPQQTYTRSSLWNLFTQSPKQESDKLFQDLHSQDLFPEGYHSEDLSASVDKIEKTATSCSTQKSFEERIFQPWQTLPSKDSSEESPLPTKKEDLLAEKTSFSQEKDPYIKESKIGKPSSFLAKDFEKDEHSDQQKEEQQKEFTEKVKKKSASSQKISENASIFKNKNKKVKKPLAPELVVPVIPLPSVGIFTLSYLLTKQGILCDYTSYGAYKDNIETTQKELELTHEQRIKELKNNLDKENTAKRWGTLATLVEWVMPWLSIGLSVLSISSGESVFATLTLFSGLITLTLALMDSMNAWEKLERFLPGSNQEKKRKIIRIAYFSILISNCFLSFATVKFHRLEMSSVINGLMLGVAPAFESASAVIRSGAIWTRSMVIAAKGSLVSLENLIDQLNQERDDTYQSVEELVENIQEQFEAISRILSLEQELNASHLSLMRS